VRDRSAPELPRVMLDANILVALFVKGRDYSLVRACENGRLRPVLCDYMVAEASRMIRAAFRRRAGELPEVLASLQAERTPTPDRDTLGQYEPLASDPSDQPVVVAALEAQVDFLVTSDRRLRESAAESLARRGARLKVVSVPELLAEMGGNLDFRRS
jgi:predicted nucleic acid-binding protein